MSHYYIYHCRDRQKKKKNCNEIDLFSLLHYCFSHQIYYFEIWNDQFNEKEKSKFANEKDSGELTSICKFINKDVQLTIFTSIYIYRMSVFLYRINVDFSFAKI